MSSLPCVDDWFLAAGFADYVEKPFDVRDLPGRVRRAARAASR
jgi:DNA-binding response OmpR family regulator